MIYYIFLKRLAYLFWFRFIFIRSKLSLFGSLKRFKGIHHGERVFIVATGPSLTAKDLDLLKDEITFSMNSVFKLFDQTEWRPSYYCITDGGVYKKIKDEIDEYPLNICFVNSSISWEKKGLIRIPIIPSLCNTEELRTKFKRFSTHSHTSSNICKGLFMGNSVVHVITQICFYMGFSEIYFIGADCSNFKSHATNCEHNLTISRPEDSLANGIMADYEADYEYAKKHNIKMFNATRGGALEVFPRVCLEDII